MSDPIAFMVMPFNVRKTGVGEPGVPPEVDFDRLWEKVHRPVLEELGYRPVRADQDVGALIIKEMIERLTLADLVVADLTLPNANVYYEIGVRHAAKRAGCVLISAEWSKPLFDLAQMRQLRFPLPEGKVLAATARKARAALKTGLGPLADGASPVYQSVPGFPNALNIRAFEDVVNDLLEFDAAVRRARAAPRNQRAELALAVRDQYGGRPAVRQAVVLELMRLLRDVVGWSAMLDYAATLPPSIADVPVVLEQRAVGISKTGDPLTAVGELEALVERDGETAQRLGLIGGRYKELWRAATNDQDKADYLNRAIDAYERGMLRDLNGYYPASNLPRLYRARGGEGDDRLAADAEAATALACRAAIRAGTEDEWARATLLGLAFGRGDVQHARALLDEVRREGPATWMLETTIKDLLDNVAQQKDPAVRDGLAAVLAELMEMLPQPIPAQA
ncbi:MAG TPA: TRAFs-binding domain-containing protein [Solirubrobacteraceae bacterium]|nr:TRAFs-binding domain-containing protein [Solirubrobacteraceae bacterium]